MRRRAVRYTLLAVALFLVVAQWVGPERSNPPIDPAETLEATTTLPAPVAATLRRACFDCHSHETRWPWYSRVAPVSWFVIGHVNEGREHLNFSRWGSYPPDERADLLEDACKEVRKGGMPLPPYLLVHREARLTPDDVEAVCAWAGSKP